MYSTISISPHPSSAGQLLSSPQFLTQPSSNGNITAFRTATVPCSVAPGITTSTSWLKEGAPLDVAADPRLSLSSEGLQLTGLQDAGGASLEGVYHCVGGNSLGVVRSLPVTLTRTGKWREGEGEGEGGLLLLASTVPSVSACWQLRESVQGSACK